MSSSGSTPLSEDQFLCSLCLDVFSDPVSVPCGHSFCSACIRRHWNGCGGGSVRRACPRCKCAFPGGEPGLCPNTFAKEMAELIRARRLKDGRAAAGGDMLLCDVCVVGTKAKALRSCLVCLTSYCEAHLEPHLRVATLKTHQLMEPVVNLEERMCQKHQRLLELFCRSDQRCVCVLCTESDHRCHDTVPVERESAERKVRLKTTTSEVEQMIQDRLRKVDEIKQSMELSEANSREDMEGVRQVFGALLHSIERGQAELLESMEERQAEAQRRAQGLVSLLQHELQLLEGRRAELDTLLHTEDHLHVLQKFPCLSSAPATKDWSEISVHTHTCVGTMRRAVARVEDLLQPALTKLSVQEHERMQQFTEDVHLDPRTANPWLVVSGDGSRVWDGDVELDVVDSPQRFDTAPCVLAVKGFSTGRHYWDVEVGGKTAWDLGVARESVDRKGAVTLSPERGYWSICLREGAEYRACAGGGHGAVLLHQRPPPRTVGVFVDYEEGTVSFYDAEARSHLYSYTGCRFTERLFPLFNPELSDRGNKAPLVVVCHGDVGGDVRADVEDVTI